MKWFQRRHDPSRVSDEWIIEHAVQDTKTGWEGPRWKFPAEIEEDEKEQRRQERLERRRSIKIVGGG